MDLKLNDKICLVTGASSGIGRATAVLLAAEGARVAASARNFATLQSLQDRIGAVSGIEPILLATDLSRDGAPDRLAYELLERCGRVDVLVNNAGGSRPLSVPDKEVVWEESFCLQLSCGASTWRDLNPTNGGARVGPHRQHHGRHRRQGIQCGCSGEGRRGELVQSRSPPLCVRRGDGELCRTRAHQHDADPGAPSFNGSVTTRVHRPQHPPRDASASRRRRRP